MGFIVSLLLFHAAYDIIKDGTSPLLGEMPDEELLNNINNIAIAASGMEPHLHHVHVHRYGEHVELTMHIRLPKNTTLENAHQIADDIETNIAEKLNIDATIHMEPI